MPNKVVFSNVANDLKVKIYGEDGTGADQAVLVNDDGSIQVSVADLDIRNLTATDDAILIYGFDGTSNQKISVDTNGYVQVTAVDFDIRNLLYTLDSVELGDRRVTESSDTDSINDTSTNGSAFTIDTSVYSDASIFVKNGANPIGISLEMAPVDTDSSYFASDDVATVTVAADTIALIPVGKYGKYTRVSYDVGGSTCSAELYFIGVV